MRNGLLCIGFLTLLIACGSVVEKADPDAGKTTDGMELQAVDAMQPTCVDGEQNGEEMGIDCGGPCLACVECKGPADCPSELCQDGQCLTTSMERCSDIAPANASSEIVSVPVSWSEDGGWSDPADCDWSCNAGYDERDGACLNQRQVECSDVAPANATSNVQLVTITYSDADGWTSPAPCDWQCNLDYDEMDGACINERTTQCSPEVPANSSAIPREVVIRYTTANGWSEPAPCDFTCNRDYCRDGRACRYAFHGDIRFERGSASAWFGGDDRPNHEPRNVGQGQRLRVPEAISMRQFAFRFTRAFRSSQGGRPLRKVTLQLDVRNSRGASIATSRVDVPSTFSGGWVWWPIAADLRPGVDYVFTAFLVKGLTLGVTSGIAGDADGSWEGTRLSRTGGDDLSSPEDWRPIAWDLNYWIRPAASCRLP